MTTFPAFLDTNCLFGAYLCDTMLRLAELGIYRPLWSAGVLDELQRNLLKLGLSAASASESGGRRDIRDDLKTRAAERTVTIPDIAMPAVRRLADRGAPGRERSNGTAYGRLINGDRGGYLGYAMWRRYLKLAHGYTAAHPNGIVSYTAHELRHVCGRDAAHATCPRRPANRGAKPASSAGLAARGAGAPPRSAAAARASLFARPAPVPIPGS
jgi:hypothetical protein